MHIDAAVTLYYAVGVYSERMSDGRNNGIVAFDQPWKNIVATFYHELNEARTDADVEDAIRAGNDPGAIKFLGWVSRQGEECGDFPIFESGGNLGLVMQEVPLTDGSGTVPVQFQYSNAKVRRGRSPRRTRSSRRRDDQRHSAPVDAFPSPRSLPPGERGAPSVCRGLKKNRSLFLQKSE